MTNSFYTQPPPPGIQAFLATGYYNDGKAVKGNYHIYPKKLQRDYGQRQQILQNMS
jgi:hypothetical protein